MSKATLEFDLENNEDKIDLYRVLKSVDMACVLFEINANLKKKCKNSHEHHEPNNELFEDGIDFAFEKIHELFEEHGINMDELIN